MHFTPWLADNIDQLSEVLELDLELIGKEVAVDSFSADILAEDSATGHRVLIENQLEPSDHKQLGQIMTYLAGLDAKIIVWIAPKFTSAHLSAIKRLNEHTSDSFAFFAVSVRVVRIANSPFAPIFLRSNSDRTLGRGRYLLEPNEKKTRIAHFEHRSGSVTIKGIPIRLS